MKPSTNASIRRFVGNQTLKPACLLAPGLPEQKADPLHSAGDVFFLLCATLSPGFSATYVRADVKMILIRISVYWIFFGNVFPGNLVSIGRERDIQDSIPLVSVCQLFLLLFCTASSARMLRENLHSFPE